MEILGLDVLKSSILLAAVLLYWKFIYYKYHKKDFTPISMFFIGGILFFIGVYSFFIEKSVTIVEILGPYLILFLFLFISFILVTIAIKKHGLTRDADITLTWAKRKLPIIPFGFWMFIAFPVLFFVMAATFRLLGGEYVLFWGMIFLAWIASNARLYMKQIRN